MGVALVIAGGLVLMTFFAAGFDFLTKRRTRLDNETKQRVLQMEQRLAVLDQTVRDKDARLAQLENDLTFLNRLLDKK